MKKTLLFVTVLATSLSVFTQTQTWSLDKNHAKLGFIITHMMISEVEGRFTAFDIKLSSSDMNFTNVVIELTADINSINTDIEQRDDHLRGVDFFDASHYPILSFKSTSWSKAGDKKYNLTGDLTMHGVTKPVQLEVTLNGPLENPYTKKMTAGFKVNGILNRSDFKIGSSVSEAMLGDEVSIVASAEFTMD